MVSLIVKLGDYRDGDGFGLSLGPIIRVNPRELHIRDPHFYSSIYCSKPHIVDKDADLFSALPLATSLIATTDHHLHRARRSYVSAQFSRRSVLNAESIIHETVQRLCNRFHEAADSQSVVEADWAFASMTADIIMKRFLGHHINSLDHPDFRCPVTKAFISLSTLSNLARFLSFLFSSAQSLPIPLLKIISRTAANFLQFQRKLKENILTILDEQDNAGPMPTLLHTLVDPIIPEEERRLQRLVDEGTTLIFAGTETTARALSIGLFYILNDSRHVAAVPKKLTSITILDSPKLSELETLPYLVRNLINY